MSDADDLNAVAEKALRVRVGQDPRWRRFGNVAEMGVFASGLGWANWLAERVKATCVPPEFWSLDADEQGEPLATVACPCGHQPNVAALVAPSRCRDDGCPRSFFFDGENVYAFNTPSETLVTMPVDGLRDPRGA